MEENTNNTHKEYQKELLEQSEVYANKYNMPQEVDNFYQEFDFQVAKSLIGEGKEDSPENKLLRLSEIDVDSIANDFAILLERDNELLKKESASDFDVEKNQIEEVKKMAKQNYDFGDSTTDQFVKNYQDILIMEHDNLHNLSKFDTDKNELRITSFSKDSPNNISEKTHKIPLGIKNKSDALKHYVHSKIDFKELAAKTKNQQALIKKNETKSLFKKTLEVVRERLIGEEKGQSKKVGNNQKMKM